MSELKSYKMVEEKYCTDCVCVIPSEVYLKSEADKVIAELKEKYNELAKLHDKAIQACCDADKVIAELEESHKKEVSKLLILNREQANSANRLRDSMEQVIRHQKYRRCLAMAKWCDEVMMSCELRGYTVHRIWCNRHQWAMRWKYKWLELAEKFKEAK